METNIDILNTHTHTHYIHTRTLQVVMLMVVKRRGMLIIIFCFYLSSLHLFHRALSYYQVYSIIFYLNASASRRLTCLTDWRWRSKHRVEVQAGVAHVFLPTTLLSRPTCLFLTLNCLIKIHFLNIGCCPTYLPVYRVFLLLRTEFNLFSCLYFSSDFFDRSIW